MKPEKKPTYNFKVVTPMKDVPVRSSSEQAALSLMMQDPDILTKQNWDSSYFVLEAHKIIFEAIKAVHSRAGRADEFMVIAELENAGLKELAGNDTAIYDILSCITMMPGKVCQDIAADYRYELRKAKAYRDMISYWEANEQDIRQGRGNLEEFSLTINAIQYDDSKPKRTKKEMLNQIIDEMEGKAKKDCYSTGLIMLDRNMGGGMHKGEMMTIAAETGGGKSILLVQAVVANLLEGKSCLFFSLEMSGEDIYRRLAANIAGVPVREMEDYKVNYGRELPAITEALTKLYSLPIEVIDFMHDMDSIESEIARAASENRADVIAVDYIQILNMNDSDNRETAISEAARRLKTLAAKHKSVLFTASQVNDEGRLRESRAIGMHSDQVVQIEHKNEKSRIIVKKNRRGARNYTIPVEMKGETSRFIEVF